MKKVFHADFGNFFKSPYLLVLIILFLLFTAKSFYLIIPNSVNNSNFLPVLHFAKFKASFQQDIMYQTTQYLFSFYYFLPSVLAPFFKPEFILYSVLGLQNLLIFLGLFVLSQSLFDDQLSSLLAVILVIIFGVVRFSLGTDVVFGSNLFPDLFAVPLLLFSFSLFFNDRHLQAGFLTGIIFNFHGSYAVFVMFMFTVYYLFHIREVGLKTVIQTMGLFIIGAAPLISIMFFTHTPSSGHLPFNEWLRYLYVRRGHHSFPSMFYVKRWLNFSLTMFPIIAAFFLIRPVQRDAQRKTLFLALGVLLLFAIGTVFTEFYPVRSIINLTFFRSSRFLIILGMIYLSRYLTMLLRGENLTEALLVFVTVYILVNPNLYLLIIPITLFFVIKEVGEKHNWQSLTGKYWLVLLLLLVITETSFFFLIRFFPQLKIIQRFRLFDYYLLMGGTALFFIADLFKNYQNAIQKVKWGMFLLLIVSIVMLKLYPKPPDKADQLYLAVQKWLYHNAPTDKLVITPPFLRGFRSFSGRGIILSYYDSDNMAYVPHLGEEIMQRMKDFGFSFRGLKSVSWYTIVEILKRNYLSFDEEYFRYLANKYNCEYLVTLQNIRLDFPLLYSNELFLVYQVQ